jgi:hypothetical protein
MKKSELKQIIREALSEMGVFDQHKKKIAISTLKMHDLGAKLMGGMSKEEARNFLRSKGWSLDKISNLEKGDVKENETLSPAARAALSKRTPYKDRTNNIWTVMLNGKVIGKRMIAPVKMSEKDVKDALVKTQGYDPNITVIES